MEEYYDDNSEESASLNTMEAEEEEYLDFLEEFGAVDFHILPFLPQIKSVDELLEMRKDDQLNSTKYIKLNALMESNPNYQRQSPRTKKAKKEQYEKRKLKRNGGKMNELTLI